MKQKKILAVILVAICMLAGCRNEKNYDVKDYITLGEYKGIELLAVSTELTDEELLLGISNVLADYSVFEDVDRPIQIYDCVGIDMYAEVDGEQTDEFTVTNYILYPGFGNDVMDGFWQNLIGISQGETVDFSMIVPETFSETGLIGCEVTFHVTIISVKGPIVPELDDEFVKANLGYDTADEYLDQLTVSLQEKKIETVNARLKSEAWKTLMETTECRSYPDELLNEQIKEIEETTELYAAVRGVTVEEYIKEISGMSLSDYAKGAAKQVMMFEMLAKKEKIKLTDKEYAETVETFAVSMTGEEMSRADFENEFGIEIIKERMLWDKIQQFLVDNAILK